MAKEIKQRIVLEGEKEYNQAIRTAQRNLRTLRSELKAETAELGANATAQQKNEVKVKSLRAQIAEQEKVVKAYRDALEEVREKYGENEDEIARYEQRLNDARTSLANMKNQIDATGNSFQSIATGAKNSVLENDALARSFERIGEAGETMSGKMESIFTAVAGSIRSVIGSVWGELMEISAKADNWMDLGAFLGASATEVQKWHRAMQDAGGDITTITSLVSRLKYGGKADKVTEWFGVSPENYTDDLQYIQAVLQSMSDAKEGMVAAGTWETAMSEILGAKKVQEIDSVLSDWDDIVRRLEHWNVDEGGLGLTEGEIVSMNELAQKVRELRGDWDYLKEHWTVKLFGDLALDLTSNAQGALDALMAFMDAKTAEEKEAAIAEFQKNIEEAFTRLGEAISAAGAALEEAGSSLKQSENGWVSLLGSTLETLGRVMTWMSDTENAEKIKKFFEILIGIWAGAKMASAVANLGKLAMSFASIHNNKALANALANFGSGAGGGTGTGTGAGGGPQTVTSQTVTNQTVTNATGTNFTATSMTVPTETVSNATVANMVVQNMVGGNGGLPNTNPVVPNDGSGGYPSLPYSGGGEGTGLNGYVPISLPSGGGGDLNLTGGDAYLPNVDTVNLDSGGNAYLPNVDTANLDGGGNNMYLESGGDNYVRIGPEDYSIDEPAAAAGITGTSLATKLMGGAALAAILTLIPNTNGAADEWGQAWIDKMGSEEQVGAAVAAAGKLYEAEQNRDFLGDLLDYSATGRNLGDWGDNPWTGHAMNAAEQLYDALRGGDQVQEARARKVLKDALPEYELKMFETLLDTLLNDESRNPEDLPLYWWNSESRERYSDWQKQQERYRFLWGQPDSDMFYVPEKSGLPSDWWVSGNAGGGSADENGIRRTDLEGFLGVPAGVENAAEKGVRKGISGMKVEIDGQEAGRILAPYVSEQIVRSMG